MCVYNLSDLPIDPPDDVWNDLEKPRKIEKQIEAICSNILKYGASTQFEEIYDLLYEFINDRQEKYLPEEFYEHDGL